MLAAITPSIRQSAQRNSTFTVPPTPRRTEAATGAKAIQPAGNVARRSHDASKGACGNHLEHHRSPCITSDNDTINCLTRGLVVSTSTRLDGAKRSILHKVGHQDTNPSQGRPESIRTWAGKTINRGSWVRSSATAEVRCCCGYVHLAASTSKASANCLNNEDPVLLRQKHIGCC